MKQSTCRQEDISNHLSLDALLLTTSVRGQLLEINSELPFDHICEISLDFMSQLRNQAPYSLDVRYGSHTYRVRGRQVEDSIHWHFTDISDLLATAPDAPSIITKNKAQATETEKVKSELRDIGQNYSLPINSIPALVTLMDIEGNVLFENDPLSGKFTNPVIQRECIQSACSVKDFKRLLKRTFSKQIATAFESDVSNSSHNGCYLHQLLPIVKDQSVSNIVMISTDNSAKIKPELQLRHSADEKDALLKEIHHRVKNNLQIISSILYLKSSQLQDLASRQVMEECNRRIRSMHMIHEQLLREQDLYSIDTNIYLTKLIHEVYQSYAVPGKEMKLDCDIERMQIGADKVMTIGMIIYELLTNAMLHAFQGQEKGSISIKLYASPSHINLCITDDGRGMPEDKSWEEGMGILLVKTFVTQIKASLKIDSGAEGARFCIKFKN